MGILWAVIVGFIVGALAKLIHPGRENMGCFATILLGVAGSLLASYGGQALGLYRAGERAGFLGALVGALVILFIYGAIRGRREKKV